VRREGSGSALRGRIGPKHVLAEYLEWERDFFSTLTCCQRATPEEVEQEPEAFTCETCAWRIWQARLGDEERQALTVYRWLSSRVVQDLKLVPLVFEALGLSMGRGDVQRLLERLELIHAVRSPVSARDLGVDEGE
jgi:hypothetical protein